MSLEDEIKSGNFSVKKIMDEIRKQKAEAQNDVLDERLSLMPTLTESADSITYEDPWIKVSNDKSRCGIQNGMDKNQKNRANKRNTRLPKHIIKNRRVQNITQPHLRLLDSRHFAPNSNCSAIHF